MGSGGGGRHLGVHHLWVDATAGVAGDMLLGALLDAGASPGRVRDAIEAVIPGAVELQVTQVTRCGLRATKVDVRTVVVVPPRRAWADIRGLLESADLLAPVRERALAVFGRLATAEGRVHAKPPEQVHFHEVGAWDSIADVVGVSAALGDLSVGTVSASDVALGSGTVRTAHGDLPVPVPAVLELSTGWRVLAGGHGELTTPTGMALVTTLAGDNASLPPMRVAAVGVGAGSNDRPGRANIVRVVLGSADEADEVDEVDDGASEVSVLTVLSANVDDLDPRLWPSVLSALLDAGAHDAWLVPILMKKGRPAHTLSVLADAPHVEMLRSLVFELTSTIGVRETTVRRTALARTWVAVDVGDGAVRVKVAHRDGLVVRATPEFEDVTALAATRSVPVRRVLEEAAAAAAAAGLVPGAAWDEFRAATGE